MLYRIVCRVQDARKEAEEQIYHLLNEKINEFFEDG